jgi:hypothetical protein
MSYGYRYGCKSFLELFYLDTYNIPSFSKVERLKSAGTGQIPKSNVIVRPRHHDRPSPPLKLIDMLLESVMLDQIDTKQSSTWLAYD